MNEFKPIVPYDFIEKILMMSHDEFFKFQDMVLINKKSVSEAYEEATKTCQHEKDES